MVKYEWGRTQRVLFLLLLGMGVIEPEQFLGAVAATDAKHLVQAGKQHARLLVPLSIQKRRRLLDGLVLVLLRHDFGELVGAMELSQLVRDLLNFFLKGAQVIS